MVASTVSSCAARVERHRSEPVAAWPDRQLTRKPAGDRLLEREQRRLLRQAIGEQPGAECRFRHFVELAHREMVEDHTAVAPARASGEVVAVDHVCRHIDLARQVLDNGGGDVGLHVGEARVLGARRRAGT